MLNHRLQVLLDDERYERLKRESAHRGVPIGELVRQAIDRAIPTEPGRKQVALRRILAAKPMQVPEHPAALKAELRSARLATPA